MGLFFLFYTKWHDVEPDQFLREWASFLWRLYVCYSQVIKRTTNCNDLYAPHNARLYQHGYHVGNKFSIIGYWVRPARATCCFRSRSFPVYTYAGIQNINNRVHPIAVYRILFCIVVIFGLRLLVCFFPPVEYVNIAQLYIITSYCTRVYVLQCDCVRRHSVRRLPVFTFFAGRRLSWRGIESAMQFSGKPQQ